jgi:site-specific recombinase XerD
MGRKGKRQRIESGLSRDASGFSVRVKVTHGAHTYERERRFPPTLALPDDLPYLRAERAQLEADLRLELQQRDPAATPERGTFAGDVATYLRRVKPKLHDRTFRSRASELERWAEVFGHRPRHTLRPTDIERAFAQWQLEPSEPRAARRDDKGRMIKPRPWSAPSPKTIQNRVRSLRHLYRVLDGKRARTPLDDLQLKAPPRRLPRPVDRRIIRTVLARLIKQERSGRLRDAKTRARFLVRVTCGQRPVQIMRTVEGDVDLERRIWLVPPAKGGDPVPLPLNDVRVMAWQCFIAAKAWGHFDTRSFARTIRRAGWPAGVRPYDARHTVGIELSAAGADLGDVQHWLGQRDIRTTRAFYVPGLFERLKAVSDRHDALADPRRKLTMARARFAGTLAKSRKARRKAR